MEKMIEQDSALLATGSGFIVRNVEGCSLTNLSTCTPHPAASESDVFFYTRQPNQMSSSPPAEATATWSTSVIPSIPFSPTRKAKTTACLRSWHAPPERLCAASHATGSWTFLFVEVPSTLRVRSTQSSKLSTNGDNWLSWTLKCSSRNREGTKKTCVRACVFLCMCFQRMRLEVRGLCRFLVFDGNEPVLHQLIDSVV